MASSVSRAVNAVYDPVFNNVKEMLKQFLPEQQALVVLGKFENALRSNINTKAIENTFKENGIDEILNAVRSITTSSLKEQYQPAVDKKNLQLPPKQNESELENGQQSKPNVLGGFRSSN